MSEVISEAGVANDSAGRIVGLPSCNRLVGGKRLLHGSDSRIPGLRNGGEDLALSFAGLAPDHSGPGDVVEAGSRAVHASPDVNEQEIAFADGLRECGRWFVMGVGAVGIYGDV